MNTLSIPPSPPSPLSGRYVLAPTPLLQAGDPLVATIYAQTSATATPQVLHHRGEVLDLSQLMTLSQIRHVRVVVLEGDLQAMSASLEAWAS